MYIILVNRYCSKNEENKLLIDGLECIKSNIGNPHLLVEVENVDIFDLEKFVKKVYETNEFEDGVNVEIYKMFDKKIINARVYERGVGETDACGSGAICMFYYLYDTNQVNNNSIIITDGVNNYGKYNLNLKNLNTQSFYSVYFCFCKFSIISSICHPVILFFICHLFHRVSHFLPIST